jgi:uncharacterized alpha-E superfamily protein
MLELLVSEPTNPRSLVFQLARIEEHALGLPDGTHRDGVSLLRRRVSQIAAELREFESSRFDGIPTSDTEDFLERVLISMGGVSELLTQVFFSHVTPQVN